jgi:predicted RNA-binding Zn ribbon-like protein
MTDRPPAPPPLDLVEAFINTADLEDHTDELETPAALAAWMKKHKLVRSSERLTARDHGNALRLREALRQAVGANNGSALDAQSLGELNQIARRAALAVQFQQDGSARLDGASKGFDAAIARILAAVTASMLTGRWKRLKACANHGCQWAFYDASKNRSGRWCDMDDCGNQAKGRAFRSRQRTRD